MKLIIITFMFAALLSSCEFKNEEEMRGNVNLCDTVNVSYSIISSILDQNCVRCHNDQRSSNNIKLNSYDNAKSAANSGLLLRAVNHLPGVTPMPYQLPKLEDCYVKKITNWINTGTPQ